MDIKKVKETNANVNKKEEEKEYKKWREEGVTLVSLILVAFVLIVVLVVASTTNTNKKVNEELLVVVEKERAELEEMVKGEIIASKGNKLVINWDTLKKDLENCLNAKNIQSRKVDKEENGIICDIERNEKKYTVEIDKEGKIIVIFKGEINEKTIAPDEPT